MIKRLDEVCVINPKSSPIADDMIVSFLPMQCVGEDGSFELSQTRTYAEVKKGFTAFCDGDVLFAKITPCMENGKGCLVTELKNGIGFGSTEFHVLRPNTNEVLPQWLFYLTSWPTFRQECKKNMTGSAGQKRVPRTFLEKYTVPVPTLEQQQQQVDILTQICDLVCTYNQQLTKLDELIKSRFIELFGDRWSNDKGWQQQPLSHCATFYNGKAHEQVVDKDGAYILVTSKCIASDMQEYRKTNTLLFPLQVDDICMVMSDVPNGRALAKCIRIDKDNTFTLNQRICCFRNYTLNPTYFCYTLNRHEYFLSFNDGDSQTNLRKDDLLKCPIIIPPMELQEEFADFVEQTNKLKSEIENSLEKLETLKKSLMQEYFG